MIIYPAAFVLSAEAAGESLRFPRIGYASFTFDLAATDVTVSGEEATGPRDAPLRPTTGEYWQAPSLPATWEVDLGSTQNVDYIGLAGHTIGSEGAAFLLETSLGDFTGSPPTQVWTTFASGAAPADDSPIMLLDDVRTARHVRCTLTGAGNVPRLAVIYIGETLVMEREVEGAGFTPPSMARNTELHSSMSRGGQFLSQGIRRRGVETQVDFKHLGAAWYRANFEPFSKQARHTPYFFGWWPEQYPDEIAFVWTQDDIKGAHMGIVELWQVGWQMNGIGNL